MISVEHYKTITGDTFDIIAHKIMGDRKYTKELYEANPDHVETLIFGGGVDVNIPKITGEEVAGDLPPWRQP